MSHIRLFPVISSEVQDSQQPKNQNTFIYISLVRLTTLADPQNCTEHIQ